MAFPLPIKIERRKTTKRSNIIKAIIEDVPVLVCSKKQVARLVDEATMQWNKYRHRTEWASFPYANVIDLNGRNAVGVGSVLLGQMTSVDAMENAIWQAELLRARLGGQRDLNDLSLLANYMQELRRSFGVGMIHKFIEGKLYLAMREIVTGATVSVEILKKVDVTIYENEEIGEGDGIETGFTATLANAPVGLGTVKVVAGGVVGEDDGSGIISGEGIGEGSITSRINYTSGEITIEFEDSVADGTKVLVSYGVDYVVLENEWGWISDYGEALVKVAEGNRLRKGSIVDVANDGEALVNDGSSRRDNLLTELVATIELPLPRRG